jgi:hypothetical protein
LEVQFQLPEPIHPAIEIVATRAPSPPARAEPAVHEFDTNTRMRTGEGVFIRVFVIIYSWTAGKLTQRAQAAWRRGWVGSNCQYGHPRIEQEDSCPRI